jgi:Cell Wall Hydrolase
LLTRDFDLHDPYDLFEERFVVGAKRACIALAMIALVICGHDLVSSGPLGSTQAHASVRQDAAIAVAPTPGPTKKAESLPAPKPTKDTEVALAAPVTVAIPFNEKPATPPSAPRKVVAKSEGSLVAELAAARNLDAIEVAMASEQAMAKATAADLVLPAAAPRQALAVAPDIARVVRSPMPRPKPIKLASLNPTQLPAAVRPAPAAIQTSLPTTISVLPRRAPHPHPTADALAALPAPVQPVAPAVAAPVAPAAPQAALPAGTMQLASIDPEALAFGGGAQSSASQTAAIQISLPATISVLPPRAPGVPPPSPAQRLHLEGEARAKAEKCLSNAIYFEARDQPYQGQVAVAQVVMNRVFSGIYPHDVCGVIYQNANRHLACQFTFACDGKRKVINERAEWARARRIARDTLDGVLYVQAVGTATHYHANYVHPNWVREMKRLAREGVHLFYRPIAWGNGADEPRWSREQKKKK